MTPSPPTRRYAVIGHPVAHSRSPEIHAAFARQTGRAIDYRRVLAPLDAFAATVAAFVADDGGGFNVTVPFKLEAFALCGDRVTERARRAGAVNCVRCDGDALHGDNTDGIGLVVDLQRLAADGGFALRGARLLLLGAGGAARGVLGPLLDLAPTEIVIANRDAARALALVAAFASPALAARPFDALEGPFDVVINATSVGLGDASLPLPARLFRDVRLAYDLMYAADATPFLRAARDGGAAMVADGLGMLVEQAAESFTIWQGVRPETAPVRALLRAPSR